MTRPLHRIRLAVTLEAPYSVHGNDPGRFGLDATLLTDHRGHRILPGTAVAGRIVETWHNLGSQLGNADADSWFGLGGGRRARLMLDDLVLKEIDGQALPANAGTTHLSRIRQNDGTGAVMPGALLLAEQVASAGAKLRFTGSWLTWATEQEMQVLLPQLRAALLLQTQLGADRGVGSGRILGFDIAYNPVVAPPLPMPVGDRHRLALRGAGTLCVGTRSRRGNVFESGDVISGGTLLGAIANMLAARHGAADLNGVSTPLARNFSMLRCTHALPANRGGARPAPLPQSLVALGDDIIDAWRHAFPPASLEDTPAFQTDWKTKQYGQAGTGQGWGETRKHLRIRTAIDGEGKAKESALFAYESIYAPMDDSGEPLTEWLFDLDLSAIADQTERTAITQELSDLFGYGLFPLGKTDSALAVHLVTPNQAGADSVWNSGQPLCLKAGDKVPILLVTDALLFTTDAVADQPDADLPAIYRDAFESLADQAGARGALALSHFFATQRLEGGKYLGHRYLDHKPYQPWVLTEAGSVFVFEVKNADAAKKLFRHWQDKGIGLPKAIQDACRTTWKDHPYRPQTGFGEVMIAPQHGFNAL